MGNAESPELAATIKTVEMGIFERDGEMRDAVVPNPNRRKNALRHQVRDHVAAVLASINVRKSVGTTRGFHLPDQFPPTFLHRPASMPPQFVPPENISSDHRFSWEVTLNFCEEAGEPINCKDEVDTRPSRARPNA